MRFKVAATSNRNSSMRKTVRMTVWGQSGLVHAMSTSPSSMNGIVRRMTRRNFPFPGRYRILSRRKPNTGSLRKCQMLNARYTQLTCFGSSPTASRAALSAAAIAPRLADAQFERALTGGNAEPRTIGDGGNRLPVSAHLHVAHLEHPGGDEEHRRLRALRAGPRGGQARLGGVPGLPVTGEGDRAGAGERLGGLGLGEARLPHPVRPRPTVGIELIEEEDAVVAHPVGEGEGPPLADDHRDR